MRAASVKITVMERIGQDSGVILETETPELSFGTDVGSEREKK